jgi:four helix bundle protein
MDGEIRSHKDLIVWQKAIQLVESVYRSTAGFPRTEQYGLTSQMRRSAVSVASNIAEGSGRRSGKEFLQFLYVSRGSLCELETQIEISCRLGFMSRPTPLDPQLTEVGRMLSALIKRLRHS